jgi:hypothetical protein
LGAALDTTAIVTTVVTAAAIVAAAGAAADVEGAAAGAEGVAVEVNGISRLLLQIDRPVRMAQERLPAFVLRIAELERYQRAALWLGRFANQRHVGFVRSAATFADVARDAGADDVFPRRIAAAAAWHDVVEA